MKEKASCFRCPVKAQIYKLNPGIEKPLRIAGVGARIYITGRKRAEEG